MALASLTKSYQPYYFEIDEYHPLHNYIVDYINNVVIF